jgi:hypothetical protein
MQSAWFAKRLGIPMPGARPASFGNRSGSGSNASGRGWRKKNALWLGAMRASGVATSIRFLRDLAAAVSQELAAPRSGFEVQGHDSHQAHELLDGAIPLTEKAVHLLVVVAGFLLLAVTIVQLLKGKLS